jgi:hypothetical protein
MDADGKGAELLGMATEPAAERGLRGMLRSTLGALHGSERGGDRGLVLRAEDIVRADPHDAFDFDSSGVTTPTGRRGELVNGAVRDTVDR